MDAVMYVVKDFFGWVEFDWDMFMMSSEFYMVIFFVSVIGLAFTGSFFIKDAQDDV